MPQLHAIAGPDVGRRWNFSEEKGMMIGRDPAACDVVLTDGRISRRHCQIKYVAGFFVITNLSHTNGTLVNQQQIEEKSLEDRDVIEIGGTSLRFNWEEMTSRPAIQPGQAATIKTPEPRNAPAVGRGTADAVTPPSPPRLADPSQSIIFYGDAEAAVSNEQINLTYSQTSFDISAISEEVNLADQLKSYERRFEIVRDVVNSVVTELDLDKIFDRILVQVFNFVNAERGCVLIAEPKTGRLVPRAILPRMTESLPISRTICDIVMRDRVAILSTDAMSDKRFAQQESIIMQGIRSVMSAPIVFQDKPLGILSVDNRTTAKAFTRKDLETLSIIANLAATAIHNAHMVREQIRMETTRQEFARFLPPALVRQVVEDGRELRLGGEKADVTVLFTDIRAFTPMCANRPPEEIVRLLNVYCNELTECIFRHRGTLDKYIGDGIMAVFGCPEPYPHHAARAARCALEMRRILQKHDVLSQIKVGIALHRGAAIHGFVGSKQRIQYTVIGDTVNIASRLCDIAKGDQILISQTVLQDSAPYLQTRPMPPVAIKGKTEPIVCHELVDLTEAGRAFNPWD